MLDTLPQVTTSKTRELQFAIEWNSRQYGEASIASKQAWEMYNTAIDKNAPQEEVNDLFTIATMFDKFKHEMWHAWQDAKRDYLALMN